MKIFGIGGLPRSGKDTLAELFMEHGYFGVSLGDIVRNIARVRHADKPEPISVTNMTETSNFLRSTKGPDFALKEAIELFEKAGGEQKYKGLVVFSVRAPIEADFILEHGGEVVWVETTDEIRLLRANMYRREGEDEHTLEAMKAQEALQEKPQKGIPAEVQMSTSYIHSHATIMLDNNSNDVEAFKRDAFKLLAAYF